MQDFELVQNIASVDGQHVIRCCYCTRIPCIDACKKILRLNNFSYTMFDIVIICDNGNMPCEFYRINSVSDLDKYRGKEIWKAYISGQYSGNNIEFRINFDFSSIDMIGDTKIIKNMMEDLNNV